MTPNPQDKVRERSNLIQSFRFAFSGWGHLLRSTRNARIHVIIATVAVLLGLWLEIGPVEWAIIFLTTGVVLSAEAFNTALEVLVDLASPESSLLAKTAKDVAAGAVLFTAIAAVLIGLALFGPPLIMRIGLFRSP